MHEYTKKIVNIICNIPEGKVLTYGSVAALAGNPRGARQVSRALHSLSRKYKLPWHRIINSKGKISLPDSEDYSLQKQLLEREGVKFSKNDTINLKIYLWDGKD